MYLTELSGLWLTKISSPRNIVILLKSPLFWKDLSVIIVYYKGLERLTWCQESLHIIEDERFSLEVIVVACHPLHVFISRIEKGARAFIMYFVLITDNLLPGFVPALEGMVLFFARRLRVVPLIYANLANITQKYFSGGPGVVKDQSISKRILLFKDQPVRCQTILR